MRTLSGLPLLLLAMPALGQDVDPPVSDDTEILVVADRLKGELDLPQTPIATFDEADIKAFGASTLTELLARISPQTGSGRGRGGQPVMLVNGQRISNFREMRNYPPEAIRRVEVLPEEAALRLGYPPDARVVNLILKSKYASRRIEIDHSRPTRGGFAETQLEGTLLKIDGAARLNLTANVERTTPLFEAERNLAHPASSVPSLAGDPDPARYRTLIADGRTYGLTAAWTRGLGKDGLDGSVSLNAAATRADSYGWQGLDLVRLTAPSGETALRSLPDPLALTTHATTLEGGAGLNTLFGSWQFSATLDATHGESLTLTDRRADLSALISAAAAGTLAIDAPLTAPADPGRDRAQSTSDRVEGLTTLIGRPLRLPAGELSATIKGGFTWIGFSSRDQRSLSGPVSLQRRRVLGGINLAVPMTSRREGFLGAVGDVTLSFGADLSHLSDFSAVNDWNAGLTWNPASRLSLQASYLVNQAAPTISQLGNPRTVSFNVPLYDFSRGETAVVSVISGGNPLLRKEQQRDWKFSANWQVPFLPGGSLLVEYFRNRSDNVTAPFPLLTPEIEAAFPERVTRDATGRLVAIDSRPITLARQDASRLRWGISLSDTLGKAPPGAGGERGGMFGPGPRARPGGGRMIAMMMGGGGQGRWSLAVYHTVQFTSRVLVAPGGPLLDLLGGDSLSTSGTPRHSLEFNGGLFKRGKGLFVQGTWNAPTRVAASGLPGTNDLRFGAVTRINANLFVELGEQGKLARTVPFTKGLRLSLRFENLLDSRQKVTDANGLVPLGYQADYLDPRGRVIEIELRKMF